VDTAVPEQLLEEMVDLGAAAVLILVAEELVLPMKDIMVAQAHLIKVAEAAVPPKREIQMVLVLVVMV
jgi:hypothetical protein